MTNAQPRASENGVEIICEFYDTSLTGIDSDQRPAFTEMMNDCFEKRSDFECVLCFGASRWGRLASTDIAQQNQKQLIYTSTAIAVKT